MFQVGCPSPSNPYRLSGTSDDNKIDMHKVPAVVLECRFPRGSSASQIPTEERVIPLLSTDFSSLDKDIALFWGLIGNNSVVKTEVSLKVMVRE